jgi:hypothetical protein
MHSAYPLKSLNVGCIFLSISLSNCRFVFFPLKTHKQHLIHLVDIHETYFKGKINTSTMILFLFIC